MFDLTVKEALNLPAFNRATLVAGERGVNKKIYSVNIMEVPDVINFVNEGELLVTTTYPIKDNLEAQRNLVPNLVRKGVSALAIKPVFYDNVIPEIMLQQANDLEFPIIQLPTSASFKDILNPVLSEILNRQASILQRNDEVHKKLMNIVLNGGNLTDVSIMLSSLQNNPTSIHTNKYRMLSFGTEDPDDPVSLKINDLCSDMNRLRKLINNKTGLFKVIEDDFLVDVLIHPIIVAEERYGYLILWLVGSSSFDINIIEQAVTIAALEIVKHRAVSEVERRFRSFLIDEIIQKKISSRLEVITKGEIYGWDLNSKYIPILLEIDDFLKFYDSGKYIFSPANILRKLWVDVSSAISYCRLATITVDIGSRILILVKSEGKQQNEKNYRKLFRRVLQEVSNEKKLTVNAGVGRVIEDIMDLNEGYQQAIQALEIGKKLNGKSSITSYDELGSYRVLISGGFNPELEKFSQELLGALYLSDVNNHTDFIKTLEVILECNFNLKEAAKNLYIHYNTIRYRVSKIEEISRVSFNSTADRLNMQLALQIKRIQSIHKDQR